MDGRKTALFEYVQDLFCGPVIYGRQYVGNRRSGYFHEFRDRRVFVYVVAGRIDRGHEAEDGIGVALVQVEPVRYGRVEHDADFVFVPSVPYAAVVLVMEGIACPFEGFFYEVYYV